MIKLRNHISSIDSCKLPKAFCGAHGHECKVISVQNLPHTRQDRCLNTPAQFSDEQECGLSLAVASRRALLLSLLAAPAFLGAAAAAETALPSVEAADAGLSTAPPAATTTATTGGSSALAGQQQQQQGGSKHQQEDDDDDQEDSDGENSAADDNEDDSSSSDDEGVEDDGGSSSSSSSSSSDEDDDLAAGDKPGDSSGGSSSNTDEQQQQQQQQLQLQQQSPQSSSNGTSSTAGQDQATTTSSSSSSSTTTTNGNGKSSKAAGKGSMSANLSVKAYLQILQEARKASWPLIAQKISAGDWIALSQVLVQPPFDEVRQAAFYIPWALLQSDDFTAAVAARKGYVDFIDHVHGLATIALKAADEVAGADVQVQQAFLLLNASLDAYLAAVPPKYNRANA